MCVAYNEVRRSSGPGEICDLRNPIARCFVGVLQISKTIKYIYVYIFDKKAMLPKEILIPELYELKNLFNLAYLDL